jgi:hypothetical protein
MWVVGANNYDAPFIDWTPIYFNILTFNILYFILTFSYQLEH